MLRSPPRVSKQSDPLEGIYDGAFERQRLLELFAGRYAGMLAAVNALTERAVGIAPGGLRLDDATVRRFILTQAVTRVVRIEATTQVALRVAIAEGQKRGLSAWEIANGTRDGSFPGIDRLFKETWRNRPATVARTELQQAQVAASIDRFQASGVVTEVEARDGGTTDSDGLCNARNGRRYPISNPPQVAHPNCTLVVVPIVNEDLLAQAPVSMLAPRNTPSPGGSDG